MQVNHFLYTKLARKEDSPWGHLDWHFVFYPLQVLGDGTRQEILRRLHYTQEQTLSDFKEKVSFFPLQIAGEECLVLLYVLRKPDALDHAGRGDCFLCHGFVIPPSLRTLAPSPLALFEVLRPHLFTSREAALCSPLANRQTGELSPIELNDQALQMMESVSVSLDNEFQARMALLLRHGAGTEQGAPPVLIRGESSAISSLIDRVHPFLSPVSRGNLCCDPAFDGGNWFFFPLKIVGFSKNRPGGGDPVIVDLAEKRIELPEEVAPLLAPAGPFERWILTLRGEQFSPSQIRSLESLSALLESGSLRRRGVLPETPPGYLAQHEPLINSLFSERVAEEYGGALPTILFAGADLSQKLRQALDPVSPLTFADRIANLLMGREVPFSSVPTGLLRELAGHHPLFAQLVAVLIDGTPLSEEMLLSLPEENRVPFVRLLLVNDAGKGCGLRSILAQRKDLCQELHRDPKCRPFFEEALRFALLQDSLCGEIADILFPEVPEDDYHSLLANTFNSWSVLERVLRHPLLPDRDLARLVRWGSRTIPSKAAGRYTRAFLFPRSQPAEVREFLSPARREGEKGQAPLQLHDETSVRLLLCLKRDHWYSEEELAALGCSDDILRQYGRGRERTDGRRSNGDGGGFFSAVLRRFIGR